MEIHFRFLRMNIGLVWVFHVNTTPVIPYSNYISYRNFHQNHFQLGLAFQSKFSSKSYQTISVLLKQSAQSGFSPNLFCFYDVYKQTQYTITHYYFSLSSGEFSSNMNASFRSVRKLQSIAFDVYHSAARMLLFAALHEFLLLNLFHLWWNGLGCQSSGLCLFVWEHCVELDNLAKYTEYFINDNKVWMHSSTNNNKYITAQSLCIQSFVLVFG